MCESSDSVIRLAKGMMHLLVLCSIGLLHALWSANAVDVTCPLAKTYTTDMTSAIFKMRDDWSTGSVPSASLTQKQCAYFSTLGTVYGSNKAALKFDPSEGRPKTSSNIVGATEKVEPLGVRKEYRQMTRAERERFHQALNAMKSSYPDPESRTSEYDVFVRFQQRQQAPAARFGPAFLPWHREFLWRFETALRMHQPSIFLPYWDTTLDQLLPRPSDSAIWSSAYLGNNQGVLSSGSFARWPVVPECRYLGTRLTRRAMSERCCHCLDANDGFYPPYSTWNKRPHSRCGELGGTWRELPSHSCCYFCDATTQQGSTVSSSTQTGTTAREPMRIKAAPTIEFQEPPAPTQDPTSSRACDYLISNGDVNYILSKKKFAQIVANTEPKLENDRALVQAYIGGHMSAIDCAPNDPLFWLMSAFVDLIWEEFRQKSQTPREQRELEYPTQNFPDARHQPHADMAPFWPLKNVQGLSNHYTNYYYSYQARPVECHEDRHCGSPILWCNMKISRCTAKVKVGGDCSGLPDAACAGPCQYALRPMCVVNKALRMAICRCEYTGGFTLTGMT